MPALDALMPLLVFGGIVLVIFAILSWIAQRNARTRRRPRDENGNELS